MSNPYLPLLERYHAMISAPLWWDGRRERLVAEMDRAWGRLNDAGRQQALAYAERLYRARIKA